MKPELSNRFSVRAAVLAALSVSTLAGLANAQSAIEAYASGLLHQRTGSATLGPVDGRRLPVHNLGSSGQDGVEIQLHSVFGGGTTIEAPEFPATAGARLRIRYRGWDGLIYGNHRSTNTGNGSGFDTFDFSQLGATAFDVTDLDANGAPVHTVTVNAPSGDVPWVGQVTQCPPPCSWQAVIYWGYVNGKWHYAIGHRCACPGNGGGTGGNGTQYDRIVTPHLPPGIEPPSIGSVLVTSSGISSFTAVDSDLGTFGVSCLGLGQSHISEECTSSTGSCAPDERRLPVRNLGSSGQDGVEIKWRSASRVSFQCDGPVPDGSGALATMVTSHDWIKPSWDNPRKLRCTQTAGGATGSTSLSFDTSAFGGASISVTTSVGGHPTGGGTGDPLGYLINTNTLDWILAHPLWAFNHGLSLRISNLSSPTTGGPMTVFLLNNGTFSAVPADTIDVQIMTTDIDDASSGMSITASGTSGNQFDLGSIVPTLNPIYCPTDVDDGSGTGTPDGGVTIDDLLYYLQIFEQGNLSADLDDGTGTGVHDGGVTIDDLLYFLVRFEAGC